MNHKKMINQYFWQTSVYQCFLFDRQTESFMQYVSRYSVFASICKSVVILILSKTSTGAECKRCNYFMNY